MKVPEHDDDDDANEPLEGAGPQRPAEGERGEAELKCKWSLVPL